MSTAITSAAAPNAVPNVLTLRFRGETSQLSSADRRVLFERGVEGTATDVRARTSEIIDRVRRDGDRALIEIAREYDRVALDELEIPRKALVEALESLEPTLRSALERSAENIASVHRVLLPRPMETSPEPGIVIGRRPDPLARVGVYAPGGRAVYPSSVLMGAIPARVAGVGEIVLCSPSRQNGRPADILLSAAALAGVDRVFAVGGAGAIAAMALGTETIPRVDRVVGPGNAFVTEAKLQLTGMVAIDSPAGPSELLVIADDSSDPEIVARELLAQAEHDPLACVVAITVGERAAAAIERALERQLETAPRRAIIEQALAGQGAILSVATAGDAIAFANRYAPEHLLLAMASSDECDAMLADIRNAGTVFVGATASNAFGDYMSGANHVLPTGGLARCYSGLSTLDFIRWTTYQRIDRAAAARLAPAVGAFAEAEGLAGHAAAARAWIDESLATAPLLPNAAGLVRSEIAALSIYTETREESGERMPSTVIDLSDNTNLWGMPPAAQAALREVSADCARYPSPYSAELKGALATYVGAMDASVITGCGSDDVLDLAMRTFSTPGDTVAYSTPTFSMIPIFARVNGLVPIEVPIRDADESYDIQPERLVESGARIIYICAPNNPTATPVSRAALTYVFEKAPGLVIVDEAYAEFAGATIVDLTSRSDRVLVTRTMSKAFGLAGLRFGYGVGAPTLIDYLERARGPYKVTAPAARAVFAALAETPNALGWVRDHAMLACDTRDRFVGELRRLGLAPLPSSANFVLLPHREAAAIARRCRMGGVLVRLMTGLPRSLDAFAQSDGNALRIGVGPWEGMQQTLGLLAGGLS